MINDLVSGEKKSDTETIIAVHQQMLFVASKDDIKIINTLSHYFRVFNILNLITRKPVGGGCYKILAQNGTF